MVFELLHPILIQRKDTLRDFRQGCGGIHV